MISTPILMRSSVQTLVLTPRLNSLLLFPADVTDHIGMDIKADVRHVVKMFAGNQPDDFADCAFGIKAGHTIKRVWAYLFIL